MATRFFRVFILTVSAASGLILAACENSAPLEQQIVLTNGHIYSLKWSDPDPDGRPAPDAPFENGIWYPDAEAIYISGNKILYVGTNEGALAQAHSSAEIIDLSGGVIIPGTPESQGQHLLADLYTAITRPIRDNDHDAARSLEKAMTPEEALRTFTIWPARASGSDAATSAIKAGNPAHLTVLSVDPLNILLPGEEGIGIPASDLLNGHIVMTMNGGKIVYREQAANTPEDS